MSQHLATIKWQRTSEDFSYKTYNREHDWVFDNGVTVPVSAAPDYLGKESHVDPEQAFVGSLASCHMLTFLAIASMQGFVIDSYEDSATGFLEKNDQGKLAITRVLLKPAIVFSGEKVPSEDDLKQMHHKAHKECFIANSVNTVVEVEGV